MGSNERQNAKVSSACEMNRRVGLFLLILLLTCAAALALYFCPREPNYQGKRLSQWLAELDIRSTSEANGREQATKALCALGTNALPTLTTMLCTKDSPWTKALIKLDSSQSFFHFPVAPASVVQARALQAYGILGSLAEANVPVLIRILEEEPSPEIRACVAFALGQIGRGAKTAIPALRKATGDKNARVRQNAQLALMNIQMWDLDRSFR